MQKNSRKIVVESSSSHGIELNFYLRNHVGDRFLSQVSFAIGSADIGVISGMRSCSFSAEPTTSSVEPLLPLRLA
jgi:hypothetical protein